MIKVSREDFINDVSKLHGFKYGDQIVALTDAIYSDQTQTKVTLQQLEDFVLGYQQEEVKIFIFGKLDKHMKPNKSSMEVANEDDASQDSSKDSDDDDSDSN